jgi:hypothetical protein
MPHKPGERCSEFSVLNFKYSIFFDTKRSLVGCFDDAVESFANLDIFSRNQNPPRVYFRRIVASIGAAAGRCAMRRGKRRRYVGHFGGG